VQGAAGLALALCLGGCADCGGPHDEADASSTGDAARAFGNADVDAAVPSLLSLRPWPADAGECVGEPCRCDGGGPGLRWLCERTSTACDCGGDALQYLAVDCDRSEGCYSVRLERVGVCRYESAHDVLFQSASDAAPSCLSEVQPSCRPYSSVLVEDDAGVPRRIDCYDAVDDPCAGQDGWVWWQREVRLCGETCALSIERDQRWIAGVECIDL